MVKDGKRPLEDRNSRSGLVVTDRVDDRLFVTTATEGSESCHVLAIDREQGKILWDVEVHRQNPGAKREQNSYATPTPVTDGERVYAVFADGAVVAVDFSGALALEEYRG